MSNTEKTTHKKSGEVVHFPQPDGSRSQDEMPISIFSEKEQEAVRRTKKKLSTLHWTDQRGDDASVLGSLFSGVYPKRQHCHLNTAALVAFGGLPLIYKEGWVATREQVAEDAYVMGTFFHSWAEYEDGTVLDLTWGNTPFEVIDSWSPASTARSNMKKCQERFYKPIKQWKKGKLKEVYNESNRVWFNNERLHNTVQHLDCERGWERLAAVATKHEWSPDQLKDTLSYIHSYAAELQACWLWNRSIGPDNMNGSVEEKKDFLRAHLLQLAHGFVAEQEWGVAC